MKLNRGSWGRLRQIAEVLAHHGLLMVLDHVGLSGYLPIGRRLSAKRLPAVDADWPERVRLVLAALGPTYVKLGQLASTRPDVLPEDLVRSLARLQDDVPAFSVGQVKKTLEEAWGGPLSTMVEWFDDEPLAAASIGQVHRARLFDGRSVVIKVRRPGVREQSESDFRILRVLAEQAEKRSDWAKQYGVADLVEELVITMRDELDFTVEGQNTETARQDLANNANIRVPEVMWNLTRSNVLVLESLGGTKINDTTGLENMGFSLADIAQKFIHALYQQIFLKGFFHADPHPGNIHVDRDGRLVFLDWGLVGMLSHEMRNRSVQLVLGMAEGRTEMVADALMSISFAGTHIDRRSLVRDIERLRRRYYETHLKDFQLGQAMSDLFRVAQRHQLRIPPEYMLLAKTAVTADGVVRALDSQFSLLGMGKPLAGELLWNRVNPENWAPQTARSTIRLGQHLAGLPIEFEHALRTLSRGEIRIVLEHKNIDRILGHWEGLINRMAMSLILAAIVLGLALVVHRNHLDRLAGLPIGEYAFILAVGLAIWAIIGAMRRGRL